MFERAERQKGGYLKRLKSCTVRVLEEVKKIFFKAEKVKSCRISRQKEVKMVKNAKKVKT